MEIDKLALLCINKDNHLLLARSKGKENYYLPGGKRELGETDQAALTREIHEELSVNLVPDTIKYLKTFSAQADDKPEGTLVKMTCYTAEFTGAVQANAEIEEVIWANQQNNVPCSQVTLLILDWLKSEGMIV